MREPKTRRPCPIPDVTPTSHQRAVDRASKKNREAAELRRKARVAWLELNHSTHTRRQAAAALDCSESTVKRLEIDFGLPCVIATPAPPTHSIYNERAQISEFRRMFSMWARVPVEQ